MTTVDDLIISLRIDETSNLGKLYKQLTALVGPKGDKPIQLGAGIDTSLKRDLAEIKLDLMTLTPRVMIPTKIETISRMAFGLANYLNESKSNRDLILEKFGISETILKSLEEQVLLIGAGKGDLNIEQKMRLLTLIHTMILNSPANKGDRDTLLNKIFDAMVEVKIFQRKFTTMLVKEGLNSKEQAMFMRTSGDKIEEWSKFFDLQKKFKEKDSARFEKWVKIFKDIKDPIEAWEQTAKDIDPNLDLLTITTQKIENSTTAQEAIIAQLTAALSVTQSLWKPLSEYVKDLRGGKAVTVGQRYRVDEVVGKGLEDFFKKGEAKLVFGQVKETAMNLVELRNTGGFDIIKSTKNLFNEGVTNINWVIRNLKEGVRTKLEELMRQNEYINTHNLSVWETDLFKMEEILGTATELENIRNLMMEKHDAQITMGRKIEDHVITIKREMDNLISLNKSMQDYTKGEVNLRQDVKNSISEINMIVKEMENLGFKEMAEQMGKFTAAFSGPKLYGTETEEDPFSDI